MKKEHWKTEEDSKDEKESNAGTGTAEHALGLA